MNIYCHSKRWGYDGNPREAGVTFDTGEEINRSLPRWVKEARKKPRKSPGPLDSPGESRENGGIVMPPSFSGKGKHRWR